MQDPNSQVAGRGLSVLTAAGIKTDCGLMKAAEPGPFAVLRGSARQGVLVDGATPVAPTTTQIPPPGQPPGGVPGAPTDTGQGTVSVPVPGGTP